MIGEFRHLAVEQRDAVTIVHFRDQNDLNGGALEETGAELYELAEDDERDELLISFSGVYSLSSAALGKLLMVKRKMNAHGGAVKICDLDAGIQDIFAFTNLTNIFHVLEDEAQALSAFDHER